MSSQDFPMPDGVTEVNDEYQLNLCHYELQHLRPKGTILFGKDKGELKFQFVAAPNREDGIFAKLDGPITPNVHRVFGMIETNPSLEGYVNVTLMQFKLIFFASKIQVVRGQGPNQKTIHFPFPDRILKTHRRKFIRIPFNAAFPAQLEFPTDQGVKSCHLKDLSREGMRVIFDESTKKYFEPGARLKGAKLKVLKREMPIGLTVMSVYPGNEAGIKIIAMSEEDKAWLKDCIRILMKQILKLPDSPFGDALESDGSEKK